MTLPYLIRGLLNPSIIYPTPLVVVGQQEAEYKVIYPDGLAEPISVDEPFNNWANSQGILLPAVEPEVRLYPGEMVYGIGDSSFIIGEKEVVAKNLQLRLAGWEGSAVDGLLLSDFIGADDLLVAHLDRYEVTTRESLLRELSRRGERLTHDREDEPKGRILCGYIVPSAAYPTALVAIVRKHDRYKVVGEDGIEVLIPVTSEEELRGWGSKSAAVMFDEPYRIGFHHDDLLYAIGENDLLIGNLAWVQRNVRLRLGFWLGRTSTAYRLAEFVESESLSRFYQAKSEAEIVEPSGPMSAAELSARALRIEHELLDGILSDQPAARKLLGRLRDAVTAFLLSPYVKQRDRLVGRRQYRRLDEFASKWEKPLRMAPLLAQVRANVYWDLGFAALGSGQTYKALAWYGQARRMLREDEALSASAQAHLLLGEADCYRLQGKLEGARDGFERATVLFRESGEQTSALQADVELGHSHFLAGDVAKSLEIYDQIEPQVEDAQEPHLAADLYYRKSKSLRLKGDYPGAIETANRAAQLYHDEKDPVGIGKSQWAKGATLRLEERFDDALDLLEEVKRSFEFSGYRGGMFIIHDYGEIYRGQQHFDRAIKRFEQAAGLSRSRGEKMRLAHSLLGIAETRRWELQSHGDDGAGIDAVALFEEPLEMYIAIGAKWGIVASLIGRALARINYWEAAAADLHAALEIAQLAPFFAEVELIRVILAKRRAVYHPLNWA